MTGESSIGNKSATNMFTEDERRRMAMPTSILLERAAESLDSEGIERAKRRMNDECLAIYDAYIQWMGVVQTYLLEEAGEDAIRSRLIPL